MRSLDRPRTNIDKIKKSHGNTRALVECDQVGFTLIIKNGDCVEQTQHLEWDRVTGVFVYKLYLVSFVPSLWRTTIP